MKKVFILFALMAFAGHVFSQSAQQLLAEMRAGGLPAKAVPAKYYFSHVYDDPSTLLNFDGNDLNESSIFTPDGDQWAFVVRQADKEDQDFPLVDLWLYDGGKRRATRVLHQDADHYGDYVLHDVFLCNDMVTRDSTYRDKQTGQRITHHLKSGSPVLVLNAQEWNGTGHGIISTLVVNTSTGATMMLKGEKPIGVLQPLDNMLMLAEWGLAQNYILTTKSAVETVDTYQPTNDFEMFYHQQLTPTLNVYTARGQLVGSITCPTDCIDMVR
jgi:hypothetical protein